MAVRVGPRGSVGSANIRRGSKFSSERPWTRFNRVRNGAPSGAGIASLRSIRSASLRPIARCHNGSLATPLTFGRKWVRQAGVAAPRNVLNNALPGQAFPESKKDPDESVATPLLPCVGLDFVKEDQPAYFGGPIRPPVACHEHLSGKRHPT